jgi:hypothetical protein
MWTFPKETKEYAGFHHEFLNIVKKKLTKIYFFNQSFKPDSSIELSILEPNGENSRKV